MRKNKIKAEFWLRAPNLKILDPKVSKISKWCNVYRIFTKRSGYVYMVNISRRFFQNFDLRPQMGRRPKIRQKFESYRIFAKRSGYVYVLNISNRFFGEFWFEAPNGPQTSKRKTIWKYISSFRIAWMNEIFGVWKKWKWNFGRYFIGRPVFFRTSVTGGLFLSNFSQGGT